MADFGGRDQVAYETLHNINSNISVIMMDGVVLNVLHGRNVPMRVESPNKYATVAHDLYGGTSALCLQMDRTSVEYSWMANAPLDSPWLVPHFQNAGKWRLQ